LLLRYIISSIKAKKDTTLGHFGVQG